MVVQILMLLKQQQLFNAYHKEMMVQLLFGIYESERFSKWNRLSNIYAIDLGANDNDECNSGTFFYFHHHQHFC